MLANLSRVCKAFNEKIGSCNSLLEGLVDVGYFTDSNVSEIIRTYGHPSLRLRNIYYNGPNKFEYSLWGITVREYDVEHDLIMELLLSTPQYNPELISKISPSDRKRMIKVLNSFELYEYTPAPCVFGIDVEEFIGLLE